MPYKILQHRTFEKEVLKIPAHHQRNVYKILTKLSDSPKSLPANTKSLVGQKGIYRTRIGNLRLIYYINHKEKQILVLGINPRGDVYKIIRRILD